MKKIFILCIFSLSFTLIAYCANKSRIEFIDGSVIDAEIVSFQNGVYTLDTGGPEPVKVEFLRIKKIESLNQAASPSVNIQAQPNLNPIKAQSGQQSQPDIDSIKAQSGQFEQKLMSNPETMQIVSELAADPEFQELIKDPAIANAAKSQDIKALMSNEKFMNFINNPKIQKIGNKLKEEKPLN